MNPTDFVGSTHALGAPADWDAEAMGPCMTLPVERTPDGWRSLWRPTPEELALLKAGGAVELHVFGAGHPPVALGAVTLLTAPGAEP